MAEPAYDETASLELDPNAADPELSPEDNPLAAAAIPAQPAESAIQKLIRWSDPKCPNIAEEIRNGENGDSILNDIANRVVTEAEIDENSRTEWLDTAKAALDLAMQKAEPKSTPWPKASNVIYPLLTEAADQFAARAYPSIIQNRQIVKAAVVADDEGYAPIDPRTGGPMMNTQVQPPEPAWVPGKEPGAKAARAQRIAEHMSWQLLEEMPEWEEETDLLLHVLPVVGCEFRKTYFDPIEGRNCSVRVSAFDMIINYKARSIRSTPRVTEILSLYPYEIEENKRSGYFLDIDYGSSDEMSQDPDVPHAFYEQHRRWDLDGDGYAEPYIITVHKGSQRVARIVARYDADGIKFSGPPNAPKLVKIMPVHYYTQYNFLPNKAGGIYGWGFGHLLKSMNDATSTVLNQLIDAGTLQNTGGGFVGRGLSLQSGDLKFKPGEYKVVNALGSSVRDAVVPFKHNPPSEVLFKLLGLLIEAGKSISSVKDVLTGEVRAQTMSPTVFMALVEQGLKVFTAIYKRVHRRLKDEFEKIVRLNRIYLEQQTSYKVGNEWKKITRADYTEPGSGVEPISDPTMVADAQRMARSEFLMQFKDDPMLNGLEIRKRALVAANIENVEALLIMKPAPNPEVMLKTVELELKAVTARAQALVYMTQAIKNLAEADAKVMEPFQTWAVESLGLMKGEMDAINQRKQSAQEAGQTAEATERQHEQQIERDAIAAEQSSAAAE